MAHLKHNIVTCCRFAIQAGMGMNASMKKSTAILAISCLLLATGIGASALLFAPDTSKTNVVSSGTALVGGPFEATNQDGKRVSEQDFLGKHTLFYFGYHVLSRYLPGRVAGDLRRPERD